MLLEFLVKLALIRTLDIAKMQRKTYNSKDNREKTGLKFKSKMSFCFIYLLYDVHSLVGCISSSISDTD